MPAVVSESGVIAGSNVVGPLRSSNDREGAGVDVQAPASFHATSDDEHMVKTTAPQPCVDCSIIFLQQSKRLEENPIEDHLWAIKSDIVDKAVHLKTIIDELAGFCRETRNVHVRI